MAKRRFLPNQRGWRPFVTILFKIAAACAACFMSSAPAFAESYWENGNFYKPEPDFGTMVLIDSGERFGLWRVVGQAGNVAWVSGAYTHDGFNFYAAEPARLQTKYSWVNLAGISQTHTGIAHHAVPTTIGQSYTLTFYVGNIYDPGGPYGTSSTVAVYENDTLLGTATNSGGQGSTDENWQLFTMSFVATAAYTTIAFINMDPPGDLNCGISNTLLAPTPDKPTSKGSK
jgi:hypothetical protein